MSGVIFKRRTYKASAAETVPVSGHLRPESWNQHTLKMPTVVYGDQNAVREESSYHHRAQGGGHGKVGTCTAALRECHDFRKNAGRDSSATVLRYVDGEAFLYFQILYNPRAQCAPTGCQTRHAAARTKTWCDTLEAAAWCFSWRQQAVRHTGLYGDGDGGSRMCVENFRGALAGQRTGGRRDCARGRVERDGIGVRLFCHGSSAAFGAGRVHCAGATNINTLTH